MAGGVVVVVVVVEPPAHPGRGVDGMAVTLIGGVDQVQGPESDKT